MDRIDTATRPLDALCDDIVVRYHAPLRRRLDDIGEALVHLTGIGGSPALESMRCALAGLTDRIESHLAKEEHLLFPAIAALAAGDRDRARPPSPFVTVLHPIRMLEAEHACIETGLQQLRDLALEVTGPVALTAEWRRCVAELAELAAGVREHHRTENEVLFPGALEAERRCL